MDLAAASVAPGYMARISQAADAMAEILQKLQNIASYRTEPYLVSADGNSAADKQILKL